MEKFPIYLAIEELWEQQKLPKGLVSGLKKALSKK
jgi:hypothetical protein